MDGRKILAGILCTICHDICNVQK